MDSVADIFDRYEAVRHRLPEARSEKPPIDIDSLLDISEHADAFVFDAFGVLNVGETPIAGAAKRLEQLRERGHVIRILSNAASYNHDSATSKFRKLGMEIAGKEVVTSRDAAIANLEPGLWGCIAAPSDDLSDIPVPTVRLGNDPGEYAHIDGVLFLSTETWEPRLQKILENALVSRPRPLVIANADLVAPRDFGFSLEPGYFGHLLADGGVEDIRFFGKPFPEVYELVERTLHGIAAERIIMCGDTLHTDIIGAAARGWQTVLVTQDGLFSGSDTRLYCDKAEIQPTWRLARI